MSNRVLLAVGFGNRQGACCKTTNLHGRPASAWAKRLYTASNTLGPRPSIRGERLPASEAEDPTWGYVRTGLLAPVHRARLTPAATTSNSEQPAMSALAQSGAVPRAREVTGLLASVRGPSQWVTYTAAVGTHVSQVASVGLLAFHAMGTGIDLAPPIPPKPQPDSLTSLTRAPERMICAHITDRTDHSPAARNRRYGGFSGCLPCFGGRSSVA
jgi:hypothetical protein